MVTAGIGAQSAKPDAAKAFVQFLRGPQAAPAIKASGMDPIAKK